MVPWNSASGGFAYIWQSKWLGIIAIKTERAQIHFLSDVLVAVASLDLKVPITQGWELKQPRDDYDDDVKKTIAFMSKTTGLHVHHFSDVRSARLRRETY